MIKRFTRADVGRSGGEAPKDKGNVKGRTYLAPLGQTEATVSSETGKNESGVHPLLRQKHVWP